MKNRGKTIKIIGIAATVIGAIASVIGDMIRENCDRDELYEELRKDVQKEVHDELSRNRDE